MPFKTFSGLRVRIERFEGGIIFRSYDRNRNLQKEERLYGDEAEDRLYRLHLEDSGVFWHNYSDTTSSEIGEIKVLIEEEAKKDIEANMHVIDFLRQAIDNEQRR